MAPTKLINHYETTESYGTHLRNEGHAGAYTPTMSAPSPWFIAYERVSAARQGQSGLGLAAQRSTIDALAKARGVKLGNPNGAAALRRAGKGGTALRAAVSANADAHALDLASVIAGIRSEGPTSLRSLAEELNARGMRTRRGGRWHVSNVRNLLIRLARQ